jgi:transcriptional regulator with GAF, ATPase, and Fis domain
MAGGAPANGDLLAGDLSLREARRTFEGRLVASRLAVSRGNIAAAARSLDMDRGQLSRLLKRHGVDKQSYREAH